MKHLFFGSVALLALAAAGPAAAADIARAPVYKAPPPVVAPLPFAWTGFYFGVNAGGAWGRAPVQMLAGSGTPVDAQAESNAGTLGLRSSSFIGGIQAGYNWQAGPIVLGLEADFGSFHLRDSKAVTAPFGSNPALFTVNQSIHTNWLFTARPRLGFAASNVLIYATGGVAVTDLHYNETLFDNGCCLSAESASFSKTKTGWIAGAGLEVALPSNWSAKAEYLHAEFGGATTSAANLANEVNVHNLSKLTVEIVRAGINYRFAWGKGPVTARY